MTHRTASGSSDLPDQGAAEGRRLPRSLRPAYVCQALLATLDASDGRRRRRKRDTTPDAVGMTLKRRLLHEAVTQDPDPDTFEGWLLERCLTGAEDFSTGTMRAMAQEVFAEWRSAVSSEEFRGWLSAGAPSDDRN